MEPREDDMKNILMAVDRASTRVGQTSAWLIVALTCLIAWEVFSRYVLNTPHDWALDVQIQMYGTLFMLAGAYTLAKNGHVRGIVALTWAGWTFAQESIAIRESTFSATPLPLYPFKFMVPVAGFMLLLQGIVEIVRCVQCIREGQWPSREEDVEEVDVEKLKEMVGIDDAAGKGAAR
jgi:TRAP-type mannitol/chloroaromatic compound transport system permease small subunit